MKKLKHKSSWRDETREHLEQMIMMQWLRENGPAKKEEWFKGINSLNQVDVHQMLMRIADELLFNETKQKIKSLPHDA